MTFPGAAVWHIPWTDKNDALDWQSYFHQRNRFVAALLHSQFPHGGKMVQESFSVQVKHLISMQYSTAELRLKALEDVFAGPDQLHDDLGSKLGELPLILEVYSGLQLGTLGSGMDHGTSSALSSCSISPRCLSTKSCSAATAGTA